MRPDYWRAAMGQIVRTDIVGRDGRLLLTKSLLASPKVGMCPWCGQPLHPGRRCENDDITRGISPRSE